MGLIGRHVSRELKVRKRTGGTFTVVQEHYLRDDLGCHSSHCITCPQDTIWLPSSSHYMIPDADAILDFLEILELPQVTGVIYLASVVQEVHKRGTQRTSSRLRALYSDPRRQNLYFDDQHRADTWLMLKDRLDSYSSMESFSQTKIPMKVDDKLEEKSRKHQNDHLWIAMQVVAEWFARHLNEKVPIVIVSSALKNTILSSDTELDNLLSALTLESTKKHSTLPSSVKLVNTSQYFQQYWGQDSNLMELYDSLLPLRDETFGEGNVVPGGTVSGARKGGVVYKEHVPVYVVEEGVKVGTIRVGVFSPSTQSPTRSFVRSSSTGGVALDDVFVPDRSLQNRAIAGDVVAVRILPRTQWRNSDSTANSQEFSVENGDKSSILTDGETAINEDMSVWDSWQGAEEDIAVEDEGLSRCEVMTGEIVRIMQRTQRDYVACLHLEDENRLAEKESVRSEALLCVPMDSRIPLVRVRTRQGKQLIGQRFLVRIDGWELSSSVPQGHVLRILGPIGDLDAECASILVANDIISAPFSTGALSELPTDLLWRIPEAELLTRRDLREQWFTCSIDPPGSKDVDDAISVHPKAGGLLEVGVHIADVSYFVKSNTILDLEARTRGTTVYLVNGRLNMLPDLLSENLCSLIGGLDRLAVSVIWTIDPNKNFEVVDTWFGRTVIHSRYQMVYEQAQMILENRPLPEKWRFLGNDSKVGAVRDNLIVVSAFAQKLKDSRKADGALELSSTEMYFELNERKEPVSVHSKHEILMNGVVAELMIAANASVARRIYETFPNASLLRRHSQPRHDALHQLVELCRSRGLQVDSSSNKALAESLERLRGQLEGTIEAAIKVVVTRSMSEAEYFSTGIATTTEGFGHYGLALPFYTHFTSPIRRYADIVVHRTLLAALLTPFSTKNEVYEEFIAQESEIRKGLPSPTELQELAGHMNGRQRASKAAQKSCNRLFLLLYLVKHPQVERAVVKKVQARGLLVFVPKYDLQGSVHFKDKQGKLLTYPKALEEFQPLEAVWVELIAEESRSRGVFLKLSLLTDDDPRVRANLSHVLQAPSPENKTDLMTKARLALGVQNPKQGTKSFGGTVSGEDGGFKSINKEPRFETMQDVISSFMDVVIKDHLLFLQNNAQSSNISMGSGEPVIPTIGSLGLDVGKEDVTTKTMQKRWHDILARAAVHRAKRMRSYLSEDSLQQMKRREMEKKVRERAKWCEGKIAVPK